MNQVFTIYTIFYIATSLVSFFIAFLAMQRKTVKGATELAWLMFAAGFGAFCLIFETAAPVMSEKIFWAKLEYFGGVTTPVFYFIFVLRYTGMDKIISKRNLILLFIIPVFTLLLTLTNESHNLIWTGFSEISEKTNLMEYYHGIGFWTGYIAYTYLLLLFSAFLLISFIIRQSGMFRSQGWIVLFGGLFPWLSSIIYLIGISPVAGLDLTPASITISGALCGYAILHFRFLDLVPVARETLVEILPDGILALDAQDRIQDINHAAISFLDIRLKKPVGIVATDSGATREQLLNAVINSEPISQIEVLYGDIMKSFRIIKQPVRNQQGSRLVIIHDITDLRQTQQELICAKEQAEESDRLKSAFLANMSHEIRTPMNGILGFTELLKMPDLTGEEHRSYLEIIKKSGDRMLSIINDIIDISKIEAGQMHVCISEKNVNELAESIISFFRPEANSKGIRLSLEKKLSSDEAVIKTDFDKLYAILTNLVKNAIKFTPSGSVVMGYEKKGNSLEFSVRDTGIGIRANHKEFIFERFRQGSESLSRNYEGTGLGLSLSKAYVKMLDGRIWFDSDHGNGSVFYFSIPYIPGLNQVNKEPVEVTGIPGPGTLKDLVVLIAEDDEPSQMYLTRIIAPYSRKILKVKTGEDAVEACRKNSDINLVLMDIKLPGIDGYAAIRQIRSFNNDIIVIAQTGFGLMGDKEKTLIAGSNDYISKPVDSSMLIKMLQKYFGSQYGLE